MISKLSLCFSLIDAMQCTEACSWPRRFRWSSAISSFSSAKGAANAELTTWPCHATDTSNMSDTSGSAKPTFTMARRPLDLNAAGPQKKHAKPCKRRAKDAQKTCKNTKTKTHCLLNVISLDCSTTSG